MKTALTHFLYLLLLACSPVIYAQKAEMDNCYGPDPLLYNGVLYRYYVAPSTSGTQFFSGREFREGSVKIRGVDFNGVDLNYDVYNQKLVLKYNTPAGGIDQLALSDTWLEAFTIGNDYFRLYLAGDSSAVIYRVLGDDSLKIFFHYVKELVLGSGVTTSVMQFNSPIRMSYLFDGSRLMRFQGNKSFVNLFSDSKQQELRKFMRKSKINVRKAGDDKLRTLLEYCNSLHI